MKKTILILIATLFLEGCNTDQETSIEVSQQEVLFPSVVEIAGKQYFEADQVQCHQRRYRISKEHIGALSQFERVGLEHCHKLIGYRPVAYVRVFNLMEWVRLQIPSKEVIDANQEALRVLE